MSREITKRLLDGFDKLCPHNMSRGPGPICDECWVSWGADEIERLLADERERVREAVLNEITGGRTAVNLGHIPEVGRALHWIIEDIRQLDLTKDLAPSTEEGN